MLIFKNNCKLPMVAKSRADWAFRSITRIMIPFRVISIKLINENSLCYKFGILVALDGSEEEIFSGYRVQKKRIR